jgi:Ca2+-binding EF-hand superfamily protein
MPAASIARQPTNTILASFAAFDTDGSGYITADELRVALKGKHSMADIEVRRQMPAALLLSACWLQNGHV